MKRYFLFAGPHYYPSGGWEDFIAMYDELPAAIADGKKAADDQYGWYHIIDASNWTEVDTGDSR